MSNPVTSLSDSPVTADTSTDFTIQAGVPFAQAIRVTLPTGRDYWLDVEDFEVLCQVRGERSQTAALMVDLAQFFTVTLDGVDDVLINWAMTGADTRALEGKSGYYDMLITDAGTADARGLPPILEGMLIVEPIVTAAVAEGA